MHTATQARLKFFGSAPKNHMILDKSLDLWEPQFLTHVIGKGGRAVSIPALWIQLK